MGERDQHEKEHDQPPNHHQPQLPPTQAVYVCQFFSQVATASDDAVYGSSQGVIKYEGHLPVKADGTIGMSKRLERMLDAVLERALKRDR